MRPKGRKARAAWDAGVDWAHDFIASNPKMSRREVEAQVQGSCLDLCGGDDYDADFAWEGARTLIRAKFEGAA